MKDALGDVQSVLVLGGTSDIAQAICRKLAARRAARIVLAVRKRESFDGIAAELRAAGAATVDTVPFGAMRRMRWLRLSAMKRLPSPASASAFGPQNSACQAGPSR